MAAPGRPPIYSQELADLVCERIASGRSMRDVCRDEDIPARSVVSKWLSTIPGFADQYARAVKQRSEYWIDELCDISDDGSNDWMERNEPNNPGYQYNGEAVARSRLRVDTRKWIASKLIPKVYGDKLDVTSDGERVETISVMRPSREQEHAAKCWQWVSANQEAVRNYLATNQTDLTAFVDAQIKKGNEDVEK